MKEYKLMTYYLIMVICLLIIAICCGSCSRRVTASDVRVVVRDSVVIRDSVAVHDSVAIRITNKVAVVVRDSVVIRDSVVVHKDINSGAVMGVERYRDRQTIRDRQTDQDSKTDNKHNSSLTDHNTNHSSSLNSEKSKKTEYRYKWLCWLIIPAIATFFFLYIYNKVGRR